MRKVRRFGWGLAMIIGAAAGSMNGQAAPAYGVDSQSVYVVDAGDMGTLVSDDSWAYAPTNLYRYLTFGSGFIASMKIPHGALLLSVEIEGCDSSAAGQIGVFLDRRTSTTVDSIALVTSGTAETPGCSRFSGSIAPAFQTIDNNTYRYVVVVGTSALDSTTTFGAVRFYYQLQVSPAPVLATFNDVPTSDPAFQFIEALSASGITAGCGGGSYCPDSPLTRRQMAVFLSKALGLHWPAN